MKSTESWMATLTTSCAKCSDAQNVTSMCLPANCSGNTAKVKRTSRRQTNPKDSSWWTAVGVKQHLWADAESEPSAEPTISWPWNLLTTRDKVLFLSLDMVSHLIRCLWLTMPMYTKGVFILPFTNSPFLSFLWYFSYPSPFFLNLNAKLIIFI